MNKMTSAELNLAFAREVAGYPEAKWDHSYDLPVLTSGVDEPVFDGSRVGQRILPDYTKDWNAVIFEIHKHGLKWGAQYIGGQKIFWCNSGLLEPFKDCVDSPGDDCAALARAVLDCVLAMEGR